MEVEQTNCRSQNRERFVVGVAYWKEKLV